MGLFPDCHTFIVQEAKSSGGQGTFFINSENYKEVIASLKKNTLYLVSEYADPSFSVNIHLFIMDTEVIIFPPSTQIIEKHKNKLIYSGADFVNYKNIDQAYQEK